MSAFNKNLEAIAAKFAQDIIHVLRGASIDELVGVSSGGARQVRTNASTGSTSSSSTKSDRLGRRSAGDIQHTLNQIVALLGSHPKGLRAEQIRTSLGLDVREIPRPIAEGLNSGVLNKSGQKRATTYTVGGAAASKPSAKRKSAAKK